MMASEGAYVINNRFSTFDKHEVGFISESSFKQIMSGKDDVSEADVAEMLEEYYRYSTYITRIQLRDRRRRVAIQ